MSNKQFRQIVRTLHIVIAFILGAFIYSSTLRGIDAFYALTAYVAFPLLGLSGLALWFQARLLKWARNR